MGKTLKEHMYVKFNYIYRMQSFKFLIIIVLIDAWIIMNIQVLSHILGPRCLSTGNKILMYLTCKAETQESFN